MNQSIEKSNRPNSFISIYSLENNALFKCLLKLMLHLGNINNRINADNFDLSAFWACADNIKSFLKYSLAHQYTVEVPHNLYFQDHFTENSLMLHSSAHLELLFSISFYTQRRFPALLSADRLQAGC